MSKKYLLFLIIITIAVSMTTNTMAVDYDYYVTLTITTFQTNTGGPATLLFVQNSASHVDISIEDSNPTEIFSDDRSASRTYGANDVITVGPQSMTEGEAHTLKITFDEVKVASNYFGSCTTNSAWSFCKNCGGTTQGCPTQAGNVVGSSGYAPYIGSPGQTGTCTGTSITVNCGDEIATALDEGATAVFSLAFTP